MRHFLVLMLACIAMPAVSSVTPFTVAHISDTHISGSEAEDRNLKTAVSELNAMHPMPAFVINTGDITEMGQEQQFARYQDDIKEARMPFKNTCGNHETRWADMSVNRFIQHYGSPNISFRYNGVRFIGFNAAIWLEHHGAVSGDTRRWIVGELKKDPKGTPAVLFCHQSPMYPDSVFLTGDVELWEAIAPYNVRLFLNGHGHIFKAWTVNGVFCHMTRGMVNEDGGYSLYEFSRDQVKVYDKLNGGERQLIATVPLYSRGMSVSLRPAKGASVPGIQEYEARVEPGDLKAARVEYLVDHHQHPDDRYWTKIEASAPGLYRIPAKSIGGATLAPGHHTLAVRAVDSTGGVWIRTVNLPVLGQKTRVFEAGTALQGACAVDGSSLYVGGWDGALYCVDKATMVRRWAFQTKGAVIGRPDLDEKAVFFGSTDQNIYAVSKSTGKLLWKHATGGPIQGHTLASGGLVYAGSGDHYLYALDAGTGALRWKFQMGLHTQSRPAIADGVLYVGAWDNYFYALDAKSGALKWKKRIGKLIFFAPAVNSPLVVDGKVITCASKPPSDKESPNVFCLDAKTGETIWGFTPEAGACSYSSPTSDGQRVYLSTLEGQLHALNLKDGTVAWRAKMNESAYDCRPTVTNGQVICNTLFGSVEGFDAATGRKLWSYKTGAGLTFAWPTVSGNTVYEPSFDGTLTAIKIPD